MKVYRHKEGKHLKRDECFPDLGTFCIVAGCYPHWSLRTTVEDLVRDVTSHTPPLSKASQNSSFCQHEIITLTELLGLFTVTSAPPQLSLPASVPSICKPQL